MKRREQKNPDEWTSIEFNFRSISPSYFVPSRLFLLDLKTFWEHALGSDSWPLGRWRNGPDFHHSSWIPEDDEEKEKTMATWNFSWLLSRLKKISSSIWHSCNSFKVLCKRDSAQEAEIQSWIESVLGEKFPEGKPYEDVLKDGIVLCRFLPWTYFVFTTSIYFLLSKADEQIATRHRAQDQRDRAQLQDDGERQ